VVEAGVGVHERADGGEVLNQSGVLGRDAWSEAEEEELENGHGCDYIDLRQGVIFDRKWGRQNV